MTKEVDLLKKQIFDLESELKASMRREELKTVANVDNESIGTRVKNRIKRSYIWRVANEPDNKLGKIIRSPRTIFRIATNPSVVREIRKKNGHIKKISKKSDSSNESIFRPINFFVVEGGEKRINVILDTIDLELIGMGIRLANKESIEVRMVSTKDVFDSVLYRKMLKNGQITKAKMISFYNTAEQNVRAKVFELEVSENDIFLTKVWNGNGKE